MLFWDQYAARIASDSNDPLLSGKKQRQVNFSQKGCEVANSTKADGQLRGELTKVILDMPLNFADERQSANHKESPMAEEIEMKATRGGRRESLGAITIAEEGNALESKQKEQRVERNEKGRLIVWNEP